MSEDEVRDWRAAPMAPESDGMPSGLDPVEVSGAGSLLDSPSSEAAMIRQMLFGAVDVSAAGVPDDGTRIAASGPDGISGWSESGLLPGMTNSVVPSRFFQLHSSTMLSETPAEEILRELGEHIVVGSAAVVSSSLTVGYVIWMLRGGSLLTAFLSSMPAWQSFDPLPILNTAAGCLHDDDESLLTLVTRKTRAVIRHRRIAAFPDGPEARATGNS